MSQTRKHHSEYEGEEQYPSPEKTMDLSDLSSMMQMMQQSIIQQQQQQALMEKMQQQMSRQQEQLEQLQQKPAPVAEPASEPG